MKKTKIPASVKFQGFIYNLVQESKNVLIYSQSEDENDAPVGYEVFFMGTFFRMPQDEAFGVTAWTYKNLDEAKNKVNKLMGV